MKESIYKVGGMSCGGCVASVTRALEGLPGGLVIEVSLEAGTATVGGDHDEGAVRQAVEDAGFEFAGVVGP